MLKSKSPQIGKTLEFKQVARIKLLVRQYQLYIKFYNKYVGLLVKPDVHTVGTQCSLSQMHSSVQDVGIQCSLPAPVRPPTSVRLPYASSPYLQTPLSLSQRYHSVIMKPQTLILRHTLCKMTLHRKKP